MNRIFGLSALFLLLFGIFPFLSLKLFGAVPYREKSFSRPLWRIRRASSFFFVALDMPAF